MVYLAMNAGSEVIVLALIFGKSASLFPHLMSRLPGPDDDLSDATHGLAVARHHADRAQVMKNIFRGDRLAANAAFGKGDVFRDFRIEVVTNHEHVEMLIQRIDGERTCWISRAGKNIGLSTDSDDIRSMSSTRPFRVISMDGSALERSHRIGQISRFIQSIGVNSDLNVVIFRNAASNSRSRQGSFPNPHGASDRLLLPKFVQAGPEEERYFPFR